MRAVTIVVFSNMVVHSEKLKFVDTMTLFLSACTIRINGTPVPRERYKQLAPTVRYPFLRLLIRFIVPHIARKFLIRTPVNANLLAIIVTYPYLGHCILRIGDAQKRIGWL